jgi:hypothetical protein
MNISEATLKRVRDYAVDEPGFTAAFAAWDLSRTGKPIAARTVLLAIRELLRLGIIELVEDGGRSGKVYAYVPPAVDNGRARRVPLPDLDAGIGVGAEAAQRGVVVPHTRVEGPSDRPGRSRKRQARGVRLARGGGK